MLLRRFKAVDADNRDRVTQPGMLTIVYGSEQEWAEYQQYLRYLMREGWIDIKHGRVRVLPA